jgi:hypothetical protein
MDDADAMITEAAMGQGGVNLGLIADEVEGGYLFVGVKRAVCALDYDATTVVTAHDIHCNSHKCTEADRCGSAP